MLRLMSTASILALSLSGAINAAVFDASLVVRPAPLECTTLYPKVVIPLHQNVTNGGPTIKPDPNTTQDLRGLTITGQASTRDALTMLIISSFQNVCLLGGHLLGLQDPQTVPWLVGHRTYGAGLYLVGGHGDVTVEGMIIRNSLQDGITLAGGMADDVTFGLRGSMILNNSDDAIQNDGGKKLRFIEDMLIESKMGLSIRPGADAQSSGGSAGSYTFPIRNSLINIICVADDRPDGSDNRNPTEAKKNNCGPSRSASMVFKMSGAASKVKVDMTDTIIRYEAKSRNGWGSMAWMPGTYKNVLVVWNPRTPNMKYEGPALPDGVTITTDTSIWDKAKSDWLLAHGCMDTDSCTQLVINSEPPPPPPPPIACSEEAAQITKLTTKLEETTNKIKQMGLTIQQAIDLLQIEAR